jgi:hypothetical protein
MSDRNALHQLVDTLPEAALEAVERGLQHLQAWPPEMPRDAQKTFERVTALMRERMARNAVANETSPARTGYTSGTDGGGRWTSDGDGVSWSTGFEDGTEVVIELRRFRGQELQIERRLGISEDKSKLLYALLIKGPDGKEGHWEVEFDIAGLTPPPS